MTESHRKHAITLVRMILSLIVITLAFPSPVFSDKLVATKYHPVDKHLTFPARTALPPTSLLTERQLFDSGYQPIGVVSVVMRVGHCKTLRQCEWPAESVDTSIKAREIAAQNGADVVTLWSNNLDFVQTQSPRGLARLNAAKNCERTRAKPPLGKTQYDVLCTFDSDIIGRTLYVESRGITWHLSRSEKDRDNVRKAVKLLNGIYRKDHDRNHRRAINFNNEGADIAKPSQSTPTPLRDDIEHTVTLPPLLQSARAGNKELTRAELGRGVTVTTATAQGNTAIHFAAAAGHQKIVALLIEHHASWQQRNKNGATALYLAARYGHLATVMVLLDAGANINEQSLNFIDLTPAMVAAKYGHFALLKALLDRDADMDRKDKEGHDILTHAVAAGHDVLIKPLLARMHPERRKQGLKSALYVAIMENRPSAVNILLQQGALTDYRYGNHTPLLLAAAERHLAVVKRLLLAGANPNRFTETSKALSLVVHSHQHSKTEALENGAAIAILLLQAGADPNQWRIIEKIRMARSEERSGHEALINFLLTDGVLEYSNLQRLYSAAVRAGRVDYMRRISELAGEDILPADDPALLSAAIYSGNIPTIDRVLARGADVNRVLNTQQETPLLLATKWRDLSMVAFLLERGADPEQTNSRGQSAMSLAYAQNDLRIVRKLSAFDPDSTSGTKQ